MLNKKIEKAFNEQINAETYSSYLYLSMAAWFETAGLKGHASWMRCQAQEELAHSVKFFNHILERDGAVTLKAIAGPPTAWKSAQAVFEDAYKHEQKVTGLINKLVALARAVPDPASEAFLQWFVDEQVEEEASAKEVADKLKLVGNNGTGLLMIDQELAQRVFVYPPAALGGAAAAP